MFDFTGRKEIHAYSYLYEGIADDALKQRAKGSLEYYTNKAAFYKSGWGVLSFLGTVLPAAATFFVSINLCLEAVSAITAVATVVSSTLALFKFADKKTSYRNCAENLKSELSAYHSRSGVYRSEKGRDAVLAEHLERIIKEGYNRIEALETEQSREQPCDEDTQ